MSSYVKATNFATKDTLPTGDANKIVKGTEIDNEFNAIAGAISSKSDIASPSFTGTPAAPTATSGSNTTQIANTAFVTAAVTDTVTSTTTFTNKTINLTSNTLVGTTAQFNTALSDDNFATIAGTETLTNKTLTSPTINTGTLSSPTMTGTPVAPTAAAATNSTQVATTAHVFAERTNTATLTNKTLTSPTINSATISGGSISGITDLAVADGGTGASTLAANAVLLGNGTSALQTVAPSTSGNVLTSNGTTWTSATPTVVKGLGIGGEVWNNVIGSRATGTTYTNSRAYPIMISVYGSGTGSSNTQIYVNGALVYYNNAQWNGAGAIPGGCLIIPPGATYSVSMSTGASAWWELY